MINIIISASQQKNNKCIIGDSEEDHCFKIAKILYELLKNYDCNVCIVPKELNDLEEVVACSNHFIKNNTASASFHLDIHTDAGYNGKGSSGYYFSENGRQFINIIHSEISKITPWLDAGTRQRTLYVLEHTTAIAGLIELSFHDRLNEAKHIHENMDLYATGLLNGLIKACGLTRKKLEVDEEFLNCLAILKEKGQINNPEYWLNNEKYYTEYVRNLIKSYGNYVYEKEGMAYK